MANTGYIFPTSASSISETGWNDSGGNWATPQNIYGAGEAGITNNAWDAGDPSWVLRGDQFDLSAIDASATIQGVLVRIVGRVPAASTTYLGLVQLLNTSGARTGSNSGSATYAFPTSAATTYEFGGADNLWGNALTATWVKDSSFGVGVGMVNGTNNADAFIDSVEMDVYYTNPATPERTKILRIINDTFLTSYEEPSGSGGGEFPTENLIWYINDDSLSDGSVSTWEDLIGTKDLVQATSDAQPTKGATGVVHDGGDWMQCNNHGLTITDSFSLVFVGHVVDNTEGIFLVIRNSNIMSLMHRSNNIVGYFYNGSGEEHFDVDDSSVVGNNVCIIVTRSATNGLRIYYNGVSQSAVSNYLGIGIDSNHIVLGAYENGAFQIVPNGHISRLAAFYNVELDQTTIDAIMASDAVSSKIS